MTSVCMATHNGDRFVKEQVDSILEQLGEQDELVICDDCSTDMTVSVIKSFNDQRIHVYTNEVQVGHVRTFEKAFLKCEGDYVFFADQDDVWPEGRVERMRRAADESGMVVVVGEVETFSSVRRAVKQRRKVRRSMNYSHWVNILRLFLGHRVPPYLGSAMMLRSAFGSLFLPFPKRGIGHDVWIALLSNMLGVIYHLDSLVLYRRLHDSNVTNPNRSFYEKVVSRIYWVRSILLRMIPLFIRWRQRCRSDDRKKAHEE